MSVGMPRAEVLAKLQTEGFQTRGDQSSISCESRTKTDEICHVRIDDPAWRFLKPPVTPDDENFAIQFTDNRLVNTVYILEFVDRERALAVYRDARGAMTDAFHTPARRLGFWRSRLMKLGMWFINATAEDEALWEDKTTSAAVLLFGRSTGRSKNPVVVVVMSSKPSED
jgi:hypothetical protein